MQGLLLQDAAELLSDVIRHASHALQVFANQLLPLAVNLQSAATHGGRTHAVQHAAYAAGGVAHVAGCCYTKLC
jgi:hypothetical protein